MQRLDPALANLQLATLGGGPHAAAAETRKAHACAAFRPATGYIGWSAHSSPLVSSLPCRSAVPCSRRGLGLESTAAACSRPGIARGGSVIGMTVPVTLAA